MALINEPAVSFYTCFLTWASPSSYVTLPRDVLLTIPWKDSDLWSIVLTCRWLHQLFTPALYKSFDEDVRVFRSPTYWTRCWAFLRTLRSNAVLASYVRGLALRLPLWEMEGWNHERFLLVASRFGISTEFDIAAPPENNGDSREAELLNGDAEESSDEGSDDYGGGDGYFEKEFIVDVVDGILSKLPNLQRLDLQYWDQLQLFDRAPHFRHLVEVKICSDCFGRGSGEKMFDDALRLLSSPQLKKWSLSCPAVEHSSVRCIPPGSSGVQSMEICCPNIPIQDFDYLLSIPRSLKIFQWKGKAWTCHKVGLGVDQCQTISLASTLSSLRRAREHLEQVTIDYAFVGTCHHSDHRSESLHDFKLVEYLHLSPQALRGFHRCSSSERCSVECSHLRDLNDVLGLLPPNIRQLNLDMQIDGALLADVISQAVLSPTLWQLQKIVLRSHVHAPGHPPHDLDPARLHVPMTCKIIMNLLVNANLLVLLWNVAVTQTAFTNARKAWAELLTN